MTACKVLKTQLVFHDRCLLLWIFPCVAAGIAIGYHSPAVQMTITNFPIGITPIPIAIGFNLMLYHPLAIQKVWNYCDEVGI